jgi:hypothetical protein
LLDVNVDDFFFYNWKGCKCVDVNNWNSWVCQSRIFTYRIFLTMTTIVASVEKKIEFQFKNYLRSSMSKEKLNSLTILWIEKDMIKHIDI